MIKPKNPLFFDVASEGLNSAKDRIRGVTCMTEINDELKLVTTKDEKTLLEDFWNYYLKNNFDCLVGFNSTSFDIPMLIDRSLKYKITIPQLEDKHIDMRKVLCNEKGETKGKLASYGELLGIDMDDKGFRKGDMPLLWECSDLLELQEYLGKDVLITKRLYESAKEVGLI